jgi:hypothetical protein
MSTNDKEFNSTDYIYKCIQANKLNTTYLTLLHLTTPNHTLLNVNFPFPHLISGNLP